MFDFKLFLIKNRLCQRVNIRLAIFGVEQRLLKDPQLGMPATIFFGHNLCFHTLKTNMGNSKTNFCALSFSILSNLY